MTDKKITVQFTALTFSIAYIVSGVLIAIGQFGYSVHNWVQSLEQFVMNIPFAIYILSPAIVSYIVLKKNNKIADVRTIPYHVQCGISTLWYHDYDLDWNNCSKCRDCSCFNCNRCDIRQKEQANVARQRSDGTKAAMTLSVQA